MKQSWCFIFILNKSKDTEPSYPEFSEAPPALQDTLTIALSAAWFVFEGFNSTRAKLLSLCLKLQNQWCSWMIHTFRTLQQLCSQERLSVFPIRCQGISRLKAWEDLCFASTKDHTLKDNQLVLFLPESSFILCDSLLRWDSLSSFNPSSKCIMCSSSSVPMKSSYLVHWKSEVEATGSHFIFTLPCDHWTQDCSLSISIQTCVVRILKM